MWITYNVVKRRDIITTEPIKDVRNDGIPQKEEMCKDSILQIEHDMTHGRAAIIGYYSNECSSNY